MKLDIYCRKKLNKILVFHQIHLFSYGRRYSIFNFFFFNFKMKKLIAIFFIFFCGEEKTVKISERIIFLPRKFNFIGSYLKMSFWILFPFYDFT